MSDHAITRGGAKLQKVNSHDFVVRQHEFKRLRRWHLQIVARIQWQTLHRSGNSAC